MIEELKKLISNSKAKERELHIERFEEDKFKTKMFYKLNAAFTADEYLLSSFVSVKGFVTDNELLISFTPEYEDFDGVKKLDMTKAIAINIDTLEGRFVDNEAIAAGSRTLIDYDEPTHYENVGLEAVVKIFKELK